ncbi:hypothetical protein JZU61_04355 [bacterium]|jgi:mRNA-degrading endonuclease HigB of HigAB toxin-antitoxin module|nr:hypothetical protein [bacterium]
MEQKINVLGTPNQMAVYSRLGIAMEEASELLKNGTMSKSDRKNKSKAIDLICKVSSEMTKAYAAEAIVAKVTGNKMRMIERKDFEFEKITEAHVIGKVVNTTENE